MSNVTLGGFRDPGGHLFFVDGRVIRIIRPAAFALLRSFLSSKVAGELVDHGHLSKTTILDSRQRQQLAEHPEIHQGLIATDDGEIVEHQRIPFTSYPYEWPPEMLHAAAELTLRIADAVVAENWRLKDATPYNVLFVGPKPVFVDVLSFERREPGDMVWLAYGQFVRTFLLPLLAQRRFGLSLRDIFVTRRDGLEPEELYGACSAMDKVTPSVLSMVSLPTWLTRVRAGKRTAIPKSGNAAKATFVFKRLLDGLSRTLKSVAPPDANSHWSSYMETLEHAPYYTEKRSFVRGVLERYRPKTCLDIGCNTGEFSCLAAESDASVVGIDSDPVVVGKTWSRALKSGLDILPLVMDITRPSPDVGWFNEECRSFLSRGYRRFEMVFLLAAMHHIAKDGIPLAHILKMVHHLTNNLAIVELIHKTDPAFAEFALGRENVFDAFTREDFELESSRRFETISSQQVQPTRWLYLLKRKPDIN